MSKSQPVPPSPSAEPDPAAVEPTAADGVDGADGEENDAPLNRAERRAKAGKTEPSHVGPRGELARQVRGARARTKRPQ